MKGWLLDQNLPVRLVFVPARPVIHATALVAESDGYNFQTLT
jgi:hypothetical protein